MIRRIFAVLLALALAPPALAGSNFDWTQLQAMQKTAYLATVLQAPVAADESCVELWNPAASGKLLLLWSVTGSVSVAGPIKVGFTTTQFGTSGGSPLNKYAAAAAGVSLLRTQAAVPTFGFTGGGTVFNQPVAANTVVLIPMKGPLVVTASTGVAVCTGVTVNVQLNATFEWDEITG